MELGKLETILEDEGIIFLSYGGLLTQAIIVGMTEALERESLSNNVGMTVANNILTIFIELSQNMMTYGEAMLAQDSSFNQKGLIIVGCTRDTDEYYILSRNIIRKGEAEKIRPKIEKLLPMNKDELKSYYRELRKSGRDKHNRGAGIGFIEVARRCDRMEYDFTEESEDTLYYAFRATIKKVHKRA